MSSAVVPSVSPWRRTPPKTRMLQAHRRWRRLHRPFTSPDANHDVRLGTRRAQSTHNRRGRPTVRRHATCNPSREDEERFFSGQPGPANHVEPDPNCATVAACLRRQMPGRRGSGTAKFVPSTDGCGVRRGQSPGIATWTARRHLRNDRRRPPKREQSVRFDGQAG